MRPRSIAVLCLALSACAAPSPPAHESAIRFAHLGSADGDPEGFAALRDAFRTTNPGYDVAWHPRLTSLAPTEAPRVVFIQSSGAATVGTTESELALGDIVLVRPGEELRCTIGPSAVVFTTPDPLPNELPDVIRPDWDPRITDTPGGCAEETGAYRRILLTWLEEKGPYVYHSLNAHRVRIVDSFSHYHPAEGGFDEIYLVQMAPAGARVVTSEAVARIEESPSVTREEAATLLDEHPLAVGDLVYMPRGTMHRGVGSALIQVISVPGFMPNCEVGIDHHLRAIVERLGLEGDDALPYHKAASRNAVVK